MGYLHCEMPRRPATILDTCAIFVGVPLSVATSFILPVPGYKYLIAKRICKTSALHNVALTSIAIFIFISPLLLLHCKLLASDCQTMPNTGLRESS